MIYFKNHYILFFSCIILIFGCKQQENVEEQKDLPIVFSADFSVRKEGLRMRADPGPEGRIVQQLPASTPLEDLGLVSQLISRIKLDGKVYYEPWIKVRIPSGIEGWVYARAEDLEFPNGINVEKWQKEKRLQAFLGPAMQERLLAYQDAYLQIAHQTDFIRVFLEGQTLRDTLIPMLEEHTDKLGMEELPDLFWLEKAFPGFIMQVVAEGTAYYLFTDFNQWKEIAQKTAQNGDDQFTELCLFFFPEDGIEYFFPVWKIQTWDYGGHSLLGRGHHLKALEGIQTLSKIVPELSNYLHEWQLDLLQDITEPTVTFWEPAEAVVAELKSILDAGITSLSQDDHIALETRLEQLQNGEKYGVEFNHKSGLY